MKTITEIDGNTATIRVVPPEKHERLAALLLKAAGEDRKREVRSISTGGRGFRVPLDIAEEAGLVRYNIVIPDRDDDADDGGQADSVPLFAEVGVIPSGTTAVNDTGSPIAVLTAEERDQLVPGPAESDTPASEPEPADATPSADDSPAEETADAEEEPAKPAARKTASRAKTKPATKAADDKAGDQS
jgi:hypothetical protein